MLNIKTKILEAVNREISSTLDFNLDDYDSDSNDLYISKKKAKLEQEDKAEAASYYQDIVNQIASKICGPARKEVTQEERDKMHEAIKNYGCTFAVENKTQIRYLIYDYCYDHGWDVDLNWIDTKDVTNMSMLFAQMQDFNCDISKWDVSNVIYMDNMFDGACCFNSPIDNWDTSTVKSMRYMFYGANSFNQPIGKWNVSNVTDMSYMFHTASMFNQSIGSWDVSNVISMCCMFSNAESFNQPIGNWDVRKIKISDYMFYNATSFSQDLSSWQMQKNGSMLDMFKNCPIDEKNKPNLFKSINESILNFDLNKYDSDSNDLYISKKKVNLNQEDKNIEAKYNFSEYVNKMLHGKKLLIVEKEKILIAIQAGCTFTAEDNLHELHQLISTFCKQFGNNADLNWIDTSNVTNMESLFQGIEDFNGDITKWNVSNVVDMSFMFCGCDKFNQPIGNWDVSNVKTMAHMFFDAWTFNQDISNWDVSNVHFFTDMFCHAESFNQPIGEWNVSNAILATNMFMDASSFNQDISNWNFSNLQCVSLNIFSQCPIKNEYKPQLPWVD